MVPVPLPENHAARQSLAAVLYSGKITVPRLSPWVAATDTGVLIVKKTIVLLVLSLTILSLAACNREQPRRETETAPARSIRESGPRMAQPGHEAADSPTANATNLRGTVVETMDAVGYTYVYVDTGNEKIWAAAPEFRVKVGDRVVISAGTPMRDYHSKTLNRDFAVVYFAGSIFNETGGAPAKGAAMPARHQPLAAAPTPPQIDVSGVKKADGGMTIGELYAKKASLSGKEVVLRGKVVKFNAQIMGKNWLHVRDGSGNADAQTNDLTVTTGVAVKVGDTVLVRGKLHLDKDFGYGYKYGAIIEDAKVTRE
jgi:hypothetical protein